MEKQKYSYWLNIKQAALTLLGGLIITFRHFKNAFKYKRRKEEGVEEDNYFEKENGIFTLQYPSESIPVPDTGRYRLHNEIDDCIVCDKCVKVCPVNCIEIDAIKSPTEIKKASDGSSIRLYAGKFEIDMAKCMFCGLCTTVCPTECLTMTKTYDLSEFDVNNLAYEFSDLTKDESDKKRQEYIDHMEEKKKVKEAASAQSSSAETSALPKIGGAPKIPGAKPKMGGAPKISGAKPKIGGAPKIPSPKAKTEEGDSASGDKPKIPGAKKFSPIIKKPKKKDDE